MIKSPCIQVCKLDAGRQYCTVCLRTLEEIKNWSVLADSDKQATLARIMVVRSN